MYWSKHQICLGLGFLKDLRILPEQESVEGAIFFPAWPANRWFDLMIFPLHQSWLSRNRQAWFETLLSSESRYLDTWPSIKGASVEGGMVALKQFCHYFLKRSCQLGNSFAEFFHMPRLRWSERPSKRRISCIYPRVKLSDSSIFYCLFVFDEV